MVTFRQEVYRLVRPVANQRAFLFKEDSQTAWDHAYQMQYDQAKTETVMFLKSIITHPELMSDQNFESAIDETLEDTDEYENEEEI